MYSFFLEPSGHCIVYIFLEPSIITRIQRVENLATLHIVLSYNLTLFEYYQLFLWTKVIEGSLVVCEPLLNFSKTLIVVFSLNIEIFILSVRN